MKLSNLTYIRYGLLALGIILLLLGPAVSSCSMPASTLSSTSSSSSSSHSVTEDFKEIKWPTSGLATMLPTPQSSYGKISTESSTSLYVYIGNTSEEQYNAYVEACRGKGFTVDYDKGSTYFRANNVETYKLSLRYDEEESYMTIDLDAPKEASSSSASSSAASSSSATEAASPAAEPQAQSASNSDAPVDGIRPSFKEAMDSYEAFFNQYCDFMEKYNANPGSPTMIAEYAKFMAQYTETMNKLDALGEENMSDQELAYYTQVMARINQRLAEVAAA